MQSHVSHIGRCLLATLLMVPAVIEAQVTPSFGELSATLRSGDTVTVLDTEQREITGKVIELSGVSLTLAIKDTRRDFSPATVRQIWRRGDSIRNGLAIGAIAGLLIGGFIGPRNESERMSFFPAGGLLGAAGGLGVGAGLDAAVQGKQLVYGAVVRF